MRQKLNVWKCQRPSVNNPINLTASDYPIEYVQHVSTLGLQVTVVSGGIRSHTVSGNGWLLFP